LILIIKINALERLNLALDKTNGAMLRVDKAKVISSGDKRFYIGSKKWIIPGNGLILNMEV